MPLLQEPVQGNQHANHAQIIRVDKVQRLGHGNEHLVVHTRRHPLLLHPLGHRQVILRLHVALPEDDRRKQPDRKLNLLRPRQHLVVRQNRHHPVQRRRDVREIKPRKLPRRVRHREDHRMRLPLQAILDPKLLEHVHHVRIRPEEDVQTRLVPVAILVLPRRHLATQHVPRLQHNRLMPRVHQVLGRGQPRQTRAGDDHLQRALRTGSLSEPRTVSCHLLERLGALKVRLGKICSNDAHNVPRIPRTTRNTRNARGTGETCPTNGILCQGHATVSTSELAVHCRRLHCLDSIEILKMCQIAVTMPCEGVDE
mmetsp:Transcript_12821/g.36773  ORF Transcript_12821/g.36773 Transcript_12821/m.36773 type:complete len:312 (+) Transcript_12821:2452-3387(+)